jgi:flagellar biosynthesis protein FlhG
MGETLELEAVPEEARRRVEELLREGRGGEPEKLAARSVAIASGKGGVGKTITAVNLALYYCQRGLRVALVDLDPLSDVASLLDLAESESALSAGRLEAVGLLSDFTLPLFRNLDLLFPAPKLGQGESLQLLEMIFRRFAPELTRSYDLVIFDLPAGSAYEENLAFLPFIKLLVLVTNPEPTAHAAAGAYLRRLFALYPGRDVRLWHNRFVPEAPPGFNPTDVAGNYNRNVPEELRLGPGEAALLNDLAFVPEDPALNLLRGNPSARRNAQRFLLDALQYLLEQRLARLAGETSLPRALVPLLVGYLCRHRRMEDPEEYLEGLGEYLSTLAGHPAEKPGAAVPAFSPQERQACLELVEHARRDALRLALVRIIRHLEESMQQQHRGLPQGLSAAPADRALDHELGRLLVALNRLASRDRTLINPGGVLLFYFALYKLFRSDTVVRLVNGLVPRRSNSRGQRVRDRRRQIRNLIEKDPADRARYLKLVRLLAPVVFRQVATVVRAFNLQRLQFHDSSGGLLRDAYLKLLTSFLQDTAYGGLSVVVGFPYRNSAAAFRQGAEKLRASLAGE